MRAAPKGEPPIEGQRRRYGAWTVRRRATTLLVIGLAVFLAFDLPLEGAPAPPGGMVVTRRYDPVAAVTVFTLDIGKDSGSALFLPACPGAQILGVEGAGATVLEAPSGTSVNFPKEAAGTYRVTVAGDTPAAGSGPSDGCGDYAGTIEPAVVTRNGAQLGPSTRISKLPEPGLNWSR